MLWARFRLWWHLRQHGSYVTMTHGLLAIAIGGQGSAPGFYCKWCGTSIKQPLGLLDTPLPAGWVIKDRERT